MGDTLTITLTGRPPVRITKAAWPIIASAVEASVNSQPNEPDWWLYVREHADGRRIVHGVANVPTRFGWEKRRAGQILTPGDETVAALHAIAGDLEIPGWVVQECIADLPAEVI